MASWRLGALGVRLAAAFVGVALASIAVFAFVAIISERADVGRLASTQDARTADAVVAALDDAYRANGGWVGADLQAAVALADTAGAALELDATDGVVLLRSGPAGLLVAADAAHPRQPLLVQGQEVGVLRLAFPAAGLTPADRRLRSALAEAVVRSAGLAVLGALVVAILATRAVVRPIRRLTAAARAFEAGNRGAVVGDWAGPGELGELKQAFDAMAASLERQEQLRQAMVADVAHELRTPLAVLQAETEALVDGVSPATPEALTSLHEESLRLGRMVEDLQTLASAEAAGLRLERHPLDLAAVAAGAADSLAGRFRAAGLDVERALSPATVWADPHRLRQVVSNLLANAVKFTPPGGRVDLVVRADKHSAYLEVTDTGPGVPPEEQELIFERFFRGSAGRKVGGSGIGLAVVKELVQAHGGDIRMQSLPGRGTSLVVRLPLATERRPTDRDNLHAD